MAGKVKPIPEGYHTITPSLVIRGAAAAIEFYKKAFGAKEIMCMKGPGGMVGHAELQIGDSKLMLSDEFPNMGTQSPLALKGSPVALFLYVDNVDAWFQKAVAAGAQVTMPLADMFWGDRFGKLKDPYGHDWALATHIEDVSPEEMVKRSAAAMAQMAGKS
jgi:PhnB protein